GTVTHADLVTGKRLRRFKGPSKEEAAVVPVPGGRLLAIRGQAKGGTVRLWDVARGEEVRELKGTSAAGASLAFSPDGKRLALTLGDDNQLQVWDVDGGEMTLTLGRQVEPTAFTPDGRLLITGGVGETVVWELASGKPRLRFRGSVGSAGS